MNSVKSLSLLNTLDEKEKKLLFFFLDERKDLSDLAKNLLQHEYTDSRNLFFSTFTATKYNDKQLRNAMYNLNKYIEKVVSIRFVQNDASINNYILMNHCFQFNLTKEYNAYLSKLKQQSNISDTNNLLYSYLSQKIHVDYLEEKKRQFIQEELIKKDKLLDAFYFKEKLWNLFEIQVYKNIYHFDYTPTLSSYLPDLDVSDFNFAQNSLQFLKLLLLMYEDFENDEHFYLAFNLLKDTHNSISKKDLRLYYVAIINYAIRKFNTGRKQFRKELFNIYKLQIKHDIILNEKNLIEPYAYKNIITIGLQNKEFTWTKKFIEDYVYYLPKEEKENAFQYNMANYYYFTSNFKKCLQLLQTVLFTDVYYNLDARSIILKIYFEEKEWNLLNDHGFAFRAFILRQKDISEHHKKGYLNLIKWTNKLSNTFFDRKKKLTITERISKEKNIRELKWLMEQIEKTT